MQQIVALVALATVALGMPANQNGNAMMMDDGMYYMNGMYYMGRMGMNDNMDQMDAMNNGVMRNGMSTNSMNNMNRQKRATASPNTMGTNSNMMDMSTSQMNQMNSMGMNGMMNNGMMMRDMRMYQNGQCRIGNTAQGHMLYDGQTIRALTTSEINQLKMFRNQLDMGNPMNARLPCLCKNVMCAEN